MFGLTLSSNAGNVNMNCISNNGGSGQPIVVTNVPQLIWWGGVSGHFNGANLQCTFSLQNNPNAIVGSAKIMVMRIPSTPGMLCADISNVVSATGYTLTATGTKIAPHLQPAFLDYNVTMSAAQK